LLSSNARPSPASFPTRRSSDLERRRGQPREVPFLRTEAIFAIAQVKQRAVIDDLSLVVAPDGVGNASRANLAHVASDEAVDIIRSEEHTSEFQSRENLVCRLLL